MFFNLQLIAISM